ncbi:MAG: UbiX family flavin prenyltransferase [Candidatus Aenigmarchaeota archaeon]|nr:UbiX family flavin prenyltransferase [Candidatus Aenigmarchaeota archaeon]
MKRIIVGITGTSEVSLALTLLEFLKKQKNIETHLVITEQADKILKHETGKDIEDVRKLADHVYDQKDFFSPIASGSFKTDGMIIIPCSMKTLAGVANGFSDNLLLRAADVMLKERRKLVLVTRETPLNYIHIKNMETVTKAGGIILPPVMSLYSKPKTIEDMEKHIVGKILDIMDIENNLYRRWGSE